MNTDFIREAASVSRSHTVRTIGKQSVAEHSYHVAMLCWKLCDYEPSSALLRAALFHDLAEISTGDIPAQVKWESPVLKDALTVMEERFNKEHKLEIPDLSPKEELILKWADGLELAWYCVDQLMLGNRNVLTMYERITQALLKLEPVKNGMNELYKVAGAYSVAITR